MLLLAAILHGGAIALFACGTSGPTFNTEYAPTFQRTNTQISLFGVYKDGEMSTEAWKELGQRLAEVLGECEPAFGTPLVSAEQDEQTRADGVTDDLLASLAPAATGDTIAVLNVIGYRAQTASSASAPAPKPAPQPAPQMRRGRRGMGGAPRESRSSSSTKDPFEVELRIFSVAEKKTVGVIAMKSETTDFGPFLDRLRRELPNAKCAGWRLPPPKNP